MGAGSCSQIDLNAVVEIFMSASLVQETTAFLLEALKNNRKEEGYLQTKLLEINLLGGSPQVTFMITRQQLCSVPITHDTKHPPVPSFQVSILAVAGPVSNLLGSTSISPAEKKTSLPEY